MLIRRRIILSAVLIILAVIAVACQPTPVLTPTATLAPPTLTPTPSPTPTSAPQTYTPSFVSAQCAFEIPKGVEVECGHVVVPEDRRGDLSDTLRLAVAIYHSQSKTPAPDPVIFLQGGPGDAAVASLAERYESFIAPFLQERDFIVFDQRGTGLSEPTLSCLEVVSLYLKDLRENLPNDRRPGLYAEALRRCRDRLVSKGVNTAAYTTTASAADVKDIVTALGYEHVNLYGASYGTRLAQAVMRDHPAMVRSAVLDSALPLEVKFYNEEAASADYALDALFAACADQPACDAAYPDLKTAFFDLVKQLDAEPITVTVSSPIGDQTYPVVVDGVRLTSTVIWALHSSYLVPVVPRAIGAVRAGDYSALEYALTLPVSSYADTSIGVLASINCQEQVAATTPAKLASDLAAYPDLEDYGLSAVYGSSEALFEICKIWGAAPFDARNHTPLASDIPALILAGEFDPTTPPAFGRQLAAHLGHNYFFEFPGLGHTPGMDSRQTCPLNIALAFLREPTREPDSACVAGMQDWQFVVPFTTGQTIGLAPFTNAEMGIAGLAPAGWTDIGLGFYNRDSSFLDHTQIGLQGDPVGIEEWVTWLTEKFSGDRGFDAPPAPAGERQANGLTWKLYASSFDGNPVDLGLADSGTLSLMVIMVSHRDEHDALYGALFLPVIDALVPAK